MLSVATNEDGERVGMVVYTVKKSFFGIKSILYGNYKDRAGAVVGVAVALLVNLYKMLVVVWQVGQFGAFKNQCATGVVENGVVGDVFNAAVDMRVLLAPANLLVVEYSGGDYQTLFFDSVEVAG